MERKLQLARKIVPDLADELVKRYRILKTVRLMEPCGRRPVVLSLGMTERTVRSEIEKLNAQGLIRVSKTGMMVTEEGKEVLEGLHTMFSTLTGLTELEEKMTALTGAKKVLLAQGNSDESERTRKEMAQLGARVLLEILKKSSRIAIAGGSTMAELVEAMPVMTIPKAAMVVPARGSVGRRLELQADTLAAKLAGKLDADYRMLHLPDNLSSKVLEEMREEPEIAETILEMKQASILLLGVGNALEMAEKRRLHEEVYVYLQEKQAIAEACGYYFDHNGDVVYETNSIGIHADDIRRMETVIISAGGAKKADSLLALSKTMKNAIYIMDEEAAYRMLEKSES